MKYDPRVGRWRDDRGRFVRVSSVPAIYYDSSVKRWRNTRGQFVKNEEVQRLLPQVGKVWVRSKRGNFYKDNKVIQRTVKKMVYSEEIRKKEITDTFRVDVSLFFSGYVYDKEGTYLGKYKCGSTQLSEEYHTREHYETVIDDFVTEVNKDIMGFIRSDRRIELDKIVCVFKGWDKK